MTSIVVHGIFCDIEKCRKQVLSFILEKAMPTKPGKIKIVFCGTTFYFLLIAFTYQDCSHYEVSSLFDVYFRKHWESNIKFLRFFNFQFIFSRNSFEWYILLRKEYSWLLTFLSVNRVFLEILKIKSVGKVLSVGSVIVSYHCAKFGGHRDSGSWDMMVFICHETQQDQVIKALFDVLVMHQVLNVSHQATKVGGDRHCGSGDMMFVVVEGQDSTGPCLDRPLLFISKGHGMSCSHIQISRRKHNNLSVRLKGTGRNLL